MYLHKTHHSIIKKIFFLSSITTLIGIPLFSYGQINLQQNTVTLRITPPAPQANERVSASVRAINTDLSRSTISWFIDGEQVISGIGKTGVSFTSPPLGEGTVVRAVINTSSGEIIERTRTIIPSEVDLLWEAPSTYTPPFYKGKALPASQAVIHITAIPHIIQGGRGLSADNLMYKWQRNFRYRDFNAQSGFNAQTIRYRKQLLEDTDRITVEVSALRGDGKGVSTIIVPIFTPRVLFYRDHPLYGTQYNNAYTDTFSLTAQEETVVAEPYFFSVDTPTSLDYSWRLAGEEVSTEDEDRKNELTLRAEGGSGEARISLLVNNTDYILQLINTSLKTLFGEDGEEGRTQKNNPFSL